MKTPDHRVVEQDEMELGTASHNAYVPPTSYVASNCESLSTAERTTRAFALEVESGDVESLEH